MAYTTQPLPTKAGDIGDLARQILRLLGPAYPAPDDSTNAADALTLGRAVSDGRDTTAGSLDEAFVDTTTYLLDEWERMLALPVSSGTLTTAERRTHLLARWRTRFAGTPDAILSAVAPFSTITPTMRETLAIDSHDNPPRVYAFTILSSVNPNDAAAIYPLTQTVGVMKPAHTDVAFSSKRIDGFFCDDPNSLTNNTVL